LERWISFYVDSGISVTGIGFDERSSAYLVALDTFHFGIVFLFGDTLNVTLVRVQFDVLFADVAFSKPAHVLGYTTVASMVYFFLCFIDVATVRTLFQRVADGFDVLSLSLQVVIVALVSKELAMTEGTGLVRFGKLATRQGLFGFQVIWTVLSFAGGTPFAFAGMMFVIVMVESLVALVAEEGVVEEPLEGIAPIVVIVFLDQPDELVGGYRSCVDDHVRWVDGHDFDLVSWEDCLKLLQLGNAARSFGNVRYSVKFFGFSLLDGASLFEIMVILIAGISVGIC